jgi:hypothetical protein
MATDTPMHPSDRQIAYPKVQIIIGEPLPAAENEAVENAYGQHCALDNGYGVTGGLMKSSRYSG